MKTAKPLQSPRNSGISRPRSRRIPGRLRQTPTTTAPAPTVDPELLLKFLTSFRKGDFSVRMPSNLTGIPGKIADLLNEIIENEVRLTHEFTRVAQVVGKEGKMSQRINVGNSIGSWGEKLEAINHLITDLVQPTTETSRIIGAVAQ